jgi:hypothetical protein
VQLPNKWTSQTIVLLPKVENDFDIYNTKDGWNHKSIFFFSLNFRRQTIVPPQVEDDFDISSIKDGWNHKSIFSTF